MEKKIYLTGKIGTDVTLLDVIRQYKSFSEEEEVDTIDVEIFSYGGCPYEGESIYNYLFSLKTEYTLNTTTERAYSTAAKFVTLGETRRCADIEKVAMIHFAWAKTQGKADELREVADELEELENAFAIFYAGFFLITEEAARDLLNEDTYFDGKTALEIGYATELFTPIEALAEINIDNLNTNKTNLNMSKQVKKTGEAGRKSFYKKFTEWYASTEVNALELQDEAGKTIEFPDLEDSDTPKMGDAAKIDGEDVTDGEHTMPSLDNKIIVFKDGVVDEVKEAAEEVNAEVALEVWTYAIELADDNVYEVGNVINKIGWDDEKYPVNAQQFQLMDGRGIVTDAFGKISEIKEASENEIQIEASKEFQKIEKAIEARVVKEMRTKILAEVTAEFKKKNKGIRGKEVSANGRDLNTGDEGSSRSANTGIVLGAKIGKGNLSKIIAAGKKK